MSKQLLPGWESAIFGVVQHLLSSSALDPQTKAGLQSTLDGVAPVAEAAPSALGSLAADMVGLGASAVETAVPLAAPIMEVAAPMGEAMVSDMVSSIVAGLEGVFERHNQATIDAIKSLKAS